MDSINTELLIASLEAEGIVEPCDDIGSHPLDWMEVVGVSEWYSRIKITVFDPNLVLAKPSK